ncbi:MAG: alpha/beta fold hydrolase [Myxococcota bacterium]
MNDFTIENSRGQLLSAVLHGELGETAVILCHGMLSTKDSPKHVRIAETLYELGLPTLRFDFAGRGRSEGDLFEMTYSNEVEDLQAVIEWLAARGVRRFGLCGSSMGGAVALLAAARDERVVAIATLAAVAHPAAIDERYPERAKEWREQGYVETDAGRIGRAFLDDAEQHEVTWAVSVLLAPVLVVHGTRDEVVPVSDAHDIACAARRATLAEIEDSDHRFTHPMHLGEAVEHVRTFFERELRVAGGDGPV